MPGEGRGMTIEQEFEDQEILSIAAQPMRGVIMDEAKALTCGDRNKSYGEPTGNMTHIAEIFNAITGRDLTADEVAMFHVATKLARLRTSPQHRDSHVDAIAYMGIRYECITAR